MKLVCANQGCIEKTNGKAVHLQAAKQCLSGTQLYDLAEFVFREFPQDEVPSAPLNPFLSKTFLCCVLHARQHVDQIERR